MSRYIIQPKNGLRDSAPDFISRKLTPAKRQAQVEEISLQRRSNPRVQEIQRWLTEAQGRKIATFAQAEQTAQITGARVVEMSDEDAERMKKELPEVFVLRDQPLDLIRPRRTASAKKKITAKDLWHQNAVGLTAARKRRFKGSGKGVTIAVLDTGIDATHAELQGKIKAAYTFHVNEWRAQPMTPSLDTDGHGTHVAGLICGKKVGVAPGAEVINGMMLPHGRGNLSDFILALEWVSSQPEIQIVNLSAGIPGYLPEMRTVVADLLAVGVLPVFAVGNEGRNRTRSPGNYIDPVSVGASSRTNRVASFSSGGTVIADNHNYTVPDLVAPGESVYSCVMGGSYEAWDGTSMAAPIVSGIAALVLEKYPDITVPDLIEALFASCKNLGESTDRQGKGLVQLKGII